MLAGNRADTESGDGGVRGDGGGNLSLEAEIFEDCNEPKEFIRTLVNVCGSQRAMSKELGISPSLISLMLTGARSVSVETAEVIEKFTDGAVKKEWLVWGRPST